MVTVGEIVRLVLTVAMVLVPAVGCARQETSAYAQTSGAKPRNNDDLLAKIWAGIQDAQARYSTGCGTVTETRTSSLLKVPLVFHGKFCASRMDKFRLEYSDPEPVLLIYNGDYLNVTTGKEGKTTEILKIGDHVRKTQAYFSRENSIRNLKENFTITVTESPGAYDMKFVPRSQRFKQRINYLEVTLGRTNFLLRALEIDGKSGVNSRFDIRIDALMTERIPISEVEQVNVTTSSPDAYLLGTDDQPGGEAITQVTARAIDDRGLVSWSVALPPLGRRAVTLEYRVKSQRGVAGV